MKTPTSIPTLLLAALASLIPAHGSAQVHAKSTESKAEARAEATIESDGARVERKSVTITSENGRTVRTTTIFRDGREHTTTEVLDADGKVIGRGNEDGGPQPGDQPQAGDDDNDRPWLGLRVQDAAPALRDQLGLGEEEGVVIDAIAPGGPAAKAGLRVNDLLLKLDETPLGSPEDVRRALDECEVGQVVTLGFLRRGEKAEARATLEEKPDGGEDEGNPPPAEGGDGRPRADVRVGPGTLEIEIAGNGIEGLDGLLDDPNLPDEFKRMAREMQDRMRDFEQQQKKTLRDFEKRFGNGEDRKDDGQDP